MSDTVKKNLGIVTAYGYARSKGYEGTEEEFAELMASYAEVAEDAAQSASEAAQSATNAAGSATAASGSAVSAANSATSASGSAQDAETAQAAAQQSATAAAGSATSASGSATAASGSAAQAVQSATSAAGSATSAQSYSSTAASAAQAASGSADDADTSATAAAASAAAAAESARTLTIDDTLTQQGQAADSKKTGDEISAIKADLTKIGDDVGIKFITLEMGNITLTANGWIYQNSATRVRVKQGTSIHLPVGSIIGLSSYDGFVMYIGWKMSDNTYGSKGWLSSDFVVTEEGDYTILMREAPEASTSVAVFESLLFINEPDTIEYKIRVLDQFKRLSANLIDLSKIDNGYFETNGGIYQGSNGEKYCSEYIKVEQNATYKLVVTAKVTRASWFRAITYDNALTRVGNITQSKAAYAFDYYEQGLGFNVFTFTVPSGIYFIRVSWRAYGNEWAYLVKGEDFTLDNIETLRNEFAIQTSYFGSSHVKGINHTGYTLIAPENTLPAFILSRKHGFKYVECDVQFTSDNIPVLLHDDTINRTARNSDGTNLSETINISDITYAQVLEYDFGIYKGEEFSGTKIPSLEQFIKLCKQIGLHPYIEIKLGASEAQTLIAVNMIKKHGMIDNVTWISFSDTILGYIKTAYPKARLGYVTSTLTASTISTIQSLQNADNEVFADVSHSILTDSNVQLCIDANIHLEIWTLDDLSNINNLNQYVTGITSNRFNADSVFYGVGIN